MKKFLLTLCALGFITISNADQLKIKDQIQQVVVENKDNENGCCEDQTRRRLAPCDPHEIVFNQDNSVYYADVIAADAAYVTTYVAQPDMFSPTKVGLLTCMDYRLHPEDFMGIDLENMYVIRNAGGRASDDALRSLILLQKLFGVKEFFVIQHTDCGMQKITNKDMVELFEGSLAPATLIKNCNVTLHPHQSNNVCKWINTSKCCGKKACIDYACIDWLIIKDTLFKSVLEDVKIIRNHPLIPSNATIYGFIFDVITGELIPVPKAMKAGRAKPLVCKK